MADTFTPSLNLVKPEIDHSLNTWGIKLNGDLDLLDAHAAAVKAFMASAQANMDAAIAAAVLNAVPKGTIVAWKGVVSAIPAGWALCNGNNGTPNLQDRFIMGTGGLRPVMEVGGSDHWSVTAAPDGAHDHGGSVLQTAISQAQMPVHKHQGQTDAQGLHNHAMPFGGQFVFTYAPGALGLQEGSAYHVGITQYTELGGNHNHAIDTDWIGGGQGHAHGLNYSTTHTHSVSGPLVPAYVALCYIMRL